MGKRLKTLARSITRVFDRDPAKSRIRPYRDWFIMLVFSLILMIAIAGTHYYVFIQINASEIFQADTSGEVSEQSLDRNRLEQVIDIYEQKETRFQELRERGPEAIDPL